MNTFIRKGLWINFTNHSIERFNERILNSNDDVCNYLSLEKDIREDFLSCIEIDFSKDIEFWEKQMSKTKDYEKSHVFFHPQKGHFYLIIENTINNVKSCLTVINPDEGFKQARKNTLYKAYFKRIERQVEKESRKSAKNQEISRKKHFKSKWDNKFKQSYFNRNREDEYC